MKLIFVTMTFIMLTSIIDNSDIDYSDIGYDDKNDSDTDDIDDDSAGDINGNRFHLVDGRKPLTLCQCDVIHTPEYCATDVAHSSYTPAPLMSHTGAIHATPHSIDDSNTTHV